MQLPAFAQTRPFIRRETGVIENHPGAIVVSNQLKLHDGIDARLPAPRAPRLDEPDARGKLDVPAGVRARVLACEDTATLDRWLVIAATATAAEAFISAVER